jgi:exonuclease SbcD
VPPSTFAGFDYVALGHLHGAQVIGDGSVRYAGSPLAYSFSEDTHRKAAWLVELGGQGLTRVEAVPTVTPRPLVRVRGTMAELTTSPHWAFAESSFVSAVVTDTACPVSAMATLQRRFPYAVELTWQPEGGIVDLTGSYAERLAGVGDLDVVSSFVRHVRGTDPSASEQTVLTEALDASIRSRVEV